MKKSNRHVHWNKILMPLLAFMLVFSAVLPSLVLAAELPEIDIDMKDNSGNETPLFTEEKINKRVDNQLVLILPPGKEWAKDIREPFDPVNVKEEKVKSTKLQIIKDSLMAKGNSQKWDDYKEKINDVKIVKDVDKWNKLVINLPKDPNFVITENQQIDVNINPALIEEWRGKVKSDIFTIHAKPRLSLGGSITKDTTLQDLEKGGKVIELNLMNAKWRKDEFYVKDNFNTFLNYFIQESKDENLPKYITWDAAEKMKNKNPNDIVGFKDEHTLLLKLPSLANVDKIDNVYFHVEKDGTKFEEFYETKSITDFGSLLPDFKYENENVEKPVVNKDLMFSIHNVPSGVPSLEVTTSIKEEDIKSISNPQVTDEKRSKAEVTLILNNAEWVDLASASKKFNFLIDSLKTRDQSDEWKKVQELIKDKPNEYMKQEKIEGKNRVVKITIPHIPDYFLTKDQIINVDVPYQLLENDVKLPSTKFTITAQPKAIISGTATPTIKQADFAKGDKTILVTLVNATWAKNIATNTTNREELLSAFTWPEGSKAQIKAYADVKLSKENVVTIKLPAVSGKQSGNISFEPTNLFNKDANNLVTENTDAGTILDSSGKYDDVIIFEEAEKPTFTMTGTIKSKTSEFDIANGGRTIILTLKNDSWIDVLSKNYVTDTDDTKNDIEISINNEEIPANFKVSGKTMTITLDEKADFKLEDDAVGKVIIPAKYFAASSTGIGEDTSTEFDVLAVKVELSGTGLKMSAQEVEIGGKTIDITLKNAEFVSGLSPSTVMSFLNGVMSSWSINDKDIRITKNKVTIKLPPVPNHTESGNFSVTVPQSAMVNANEGKTADKEISIGAVATASLEGKISFGIEEFKTKKNTITIKLSEDWDPSIVSNKSKKSALLKGFTVTDQVKEWNTVISAALKEDEFKLSDKNTLEITIPPVTDYNIARPQQINITVPKTVLADYKYDIPVGQTINVTLPSLDSEESFADILESGLANYIDENGLDKIWVVVPPKKILTVKTSGVELNEKNIFTVEVETNSEVTKIQAIVHGEEGEQSFETEGNGKFTFVFDEVDKNSTLEISVYGEDSQEPSEQVFKKYSKGNKTYTETPKTQLEGTYSLHTILTDKSLLNNILKYYSLRQLTIGTKG